MLYILYYIYVYIYYIIYMYIYIYIYILYHLKSGLSHSKKFLFICFNDSPSKVMKNILVSS